MPETRPSDTDVYLDPEVEKQLKNRLSRIQGQLEGVKRMLDERESCDDILVQMAAARKTMTGAARQLMENHMETCVRDSVEDGDAGEALDSLRGALAKFLEHARPMDRTVLLSSSGAIGSAVASALAEATAARWRRP